MRARALGLAGVVVLGLLAGCTSEPDEPEVSTVGVLEAEDLGVGEWEGPHPASMDRTGIITCSLIGLAFQDTAPSAVAAGEVVWTNGEITVDSVAYYFGDDRAGLDKRIALADRASECAHEVGEPGWEPAGYMTWERSGDVWEVHERNGEPGSLWDFDVMMTATEDSFIGVMVTYPEGTTGHPDVAVLLDRAVEAAAELPALAEQQADEE